MALRQIRTIGDEILLKKSKEVKVVNDRIRELIEDMKETIVESNGVGLAAVQVGVLKRIFLVHINEEEEPVVLINPKIVETSGEQTGNEGCLSVPGKFGSVTRPAYVKVMYYDENMQQQVMEGTELLARCICHEYDHLDGKLYVDMVEGQLEEVNGEVKEES